MVLIETVRVASCSGLIRESVVRDTMSYLNSFILCQSRYLASREKYNLVTKLTKKLKPKYFQLPMATIAIKIAAYVARSGIRKMKKWIQKIGASP
jgi:hypothetical protein